MRVHRISHAGTRVRACAGAASFRGEGRLGERLAAARAHVAEASALLDDPARSAGLTAKQRAGRIEAAVARLPELQARQGEAPAATADDGSKGKGKRPRKPKGQVRVSTTDPDARVMKMGDGGFRPAVNVQLAVDAQSRAILGVAVTDAGSDMGLAPPLRAQVEARTGGTAAEHLVDGGFLILAEVDAAAAAGVALFG